jgi:hypothetical protein
MNLKKTDFNIVEFSWVHWLKKQYVIANLLPETISISSKAQSWQIVANHLQ